MLSHTLPATPLPWRPGAADQLLVLFYILVTVAYTQLQRHHTYCPTRLSEWFVAMKAMNYRAHVQPKTSPRIPVLSHWVTTKQGLRSGAHAQLLVAGLNRLALNER